MEKRIQGPDDSKAYRFVKEKLADGSERVTLVKDSKAQTPKADKKKGANE